MLVDFVNDCPILWYVCMPIVVSLITYTFLILVFPRSS